MIRITALLLAALASSSAWAQQIALQHPSAKEPIVKVRPTPMLAQPQQQQPRIQASLFNPAAWGPRRPFQHTPRQPEVPWPFADNDGKVRNIKARPDFTHKATPPSQVTQGVPVRTVPAQQQAKPTLGVTAPIPSDWITPR